MGMAWWRRMNCWSGDEQRCFALPLLLLLFGAPGGDAGFGGTAENCGLMDVAMLGGWCWEAGVGRLVLVATVLAGREDD
jgi:hypothetical protein